METKELKKRLNDPFICENLNGQDVKDLESVINELNRYQRVVKELKQVHTEMCDSQPDKQIEWGSGFGAAIDYIEDNLYRDLGEE